MNIFALVFFFLLLIVGGLVSHRNDVLKSRSSVWIFLINGLLTLLAAILLYNPVRVSLQTTNITNAHLTIFLVFSISGGVIMNLYFYLKLWKRFISRREGAGAGINNSTNAESSVNVTNSRPALAVSGPVGVINLSSSDTSGVSATSGASYTADDTNPAEYPNGNIRLDSVYTTIYAEDNELCTEEIHLTHHPDNTITGEVIFDHSTRFKLEGEFKDLILTGNYRAQDGRKPERGSINLRYFDGLLSGFCSFSNPTRNDDPIRVSPYVWVPGKDNDLVNGTYDFCTKCHEENEVCCCASSTIDGPILLPSEATKIQNAEKNRTKPSKTVKQQEFSESIRTSENVLTPIRKIKEISTEKSECGTACHFYNIDKSQCKIYENRPLDCRLFPFDIVVHPQTGELHIGYYPHLCRRALPGLREMKKAAHVLRPYFFLFYPYVHLITTKDVSPKLHASALDHDFTGQFISIGRLIDFVF